MATDTNSGGGHMFGNANPGSPINPNIKALSAPRLGG